MDLYKGCERAYEIAKKRGLKENTFEALKHCAGEVLEAVSAYYDYELMHSEPGDFLENFENELADVVICIMSICGAEKINLEEAIARKMLINEGRVD